jgi:hypothetical protein
MLQRIYQSEGGSDALDVLMKYLYAYAPFFLSILSLWFPCPPILLRIKAALIVP